MGFSVTMRALESPIALGLLQMHAKERDAGCSLDLVKEDFDFVKNESIQDWEIRMTSTRSNCTLQEGSNESLQKRVVVDYIGQSINDLNKCVSKQVWTYVDKVGYICDTESASLSEEQTYHFVDTDGGPNRQIQYKSLIPEACYSSKCPMLVALRGGMKGSSHVQCLLNDQQCAQEQGVVLLFPTIDPEVEMESTDCQTAGLCEYEELEWLRGLVKSFTAQNSNSVDADRVMLFGLSSGGTGAVWGAFRQPDVFSHVYAVSPKSFWRYKKVKGCNHSGILPSKNYKEFTSVSIPKFKERSSDSVRKLKHLVIFMGAIDLMGGREGWAQFKVLPNMVDDTGMADLGVKVEFRVFTELEHRNDIAAFNEAYNLLWRGQSSSADEGWSTGDVV